MSKYDVVIIGAGVSGLTAAALLARTGLGVCVLEEQPRPGGYMQGFSRGGFTFDTAVQWLNGMGTGGMSRKLLDTLGGDDQPAFPPLTSFQRYRGPSFDYLLSTEPERMRDQLVSDFPADADGIHRLFADAADLARKLEKLHHLSRAFETMPAWQKMFRGLRMLFWYLGFRRYVKPGLEEGLASYVRDPAFARIFIAEEKLATVLTPLAWAYQGDLFAAPAGGAQSLIAWLMERVRSSGSEVHLGERVEEVLLSGDRATGVRCASGFTASATRVICASDVHELYNSLLPTSATPDKLRQRLRGADLYASSLTLFLGVSCDPRELGLDEAQVLLTRDDVPRAEQMTAGPDRAALTVLASSVRDPTLAPPGKGTITLHCPALIDQNDRWGTGKNQERGQAYREVKARQAQAVLERVEQQLCPGLCGKVELMEAATPITCQRYTRNRDGTLLGMRATDRNIKARVAHYITPIKGLLLAGHWAEYSGGVPMAIKAAANTTLLTLRDVNRKAFKQLCEVMDA